MKSPQTQFAHRYLTPAEYGMWTYAREVSHASGVFYVGHSIVDQFDGISLSSLYRLAKCVTRKGFFRLIKKGYRNKKTGVFMPAQYEPLSMEGWAAEYPDRVKRLEPDEPSVTGDTGASVKTGAVQCQNEGSPVSKQGLSSVTGDTKSGKEESGKEKKGKEEKNAESPSAPPSRASQSTATATGRDRRDAEALYGEIKRVSLAASDGAARGFYKKTGRDIVQLLMDNPTFAQEDVLSEVKNLVQDMSDFDRQNCGTQILEMLIPLVQYKSGKRDAQAREAAYLAQQEAAREAERAERERRIAEERAEEEAEVVAVGADGKGLFG